MESDGAAFAVRFRKIMTQHRRCDRAGEACTKSNVAERKTAQMFLVIVLLLPLMPAAYSGGTGLPISCPAAESLGAWLTRLVFNLLGTLARFLCRGVGSLLYLTACLLRRFLRGSTRTLGGVLCVPSRL